MFKFPGSIGMLLLAIYLIIIGIITIFPGFAVPSILLGILALVSGILILIGR